MHARFHIALALIATFAWALFATGFVAAAEPEASVLCQQATGSAERSSGVPDQLLDAISRVESGRYDAAQGMVRAWPWTINARGTGHFYATKQEAVEAAKAFQAQGVQSMDVGCTQINLMYHPEAFASLEDAFDPGRNAAYAARFLTELFHQAGSWPHAAAAYHSQTPELGTDYQRKVLEAWADPVSGSGTETPGSRQPSSHAGDFHRQLASLSAASGTAASGAMASSQESGTPFGRSKGAPLGGFGHVLRSDGSMPAASGRNLMAYRAMPVGMLTRGPRMIRY